MVAYRRRKPFAKAPPRRRREEINAIVSAGNPSGSFHSPPPFAQGRLSPLGDYKLSPRRAGVLAKPCKRLRPAARRPPTRPKIPLPAFISFAPGMHGPRKNRPTVFPLLRGRAPEFAGIRAEHLSDHGKRGKSPAVSGERFCWTGPVRPL